MHQDSRVSIDKYRLKGVPVALWSGALLFTLIWTQGSAVQIPPADSFSQRIFENKRKKQRNKMLGLGHLEEKENKDKWM